MTDCKQDGVPTTRFIGNSFPAYKATTNSQIAQWGRKREEIQFIHLYCCLCAAETSIHDNLTMCLVKVEGIRFGGWGRPN